MERNRAIIMACHKYTPFGGEFFEPILDFQIQTLKEYQDEFEMVYFIDSNWDIKWTPERNWSKGTVIKINPSLRYYDAYKEVLPQIKEGLVLFIDNDMIIYKSGIIKKAFAHLDIRDLSVDYEQDKEQHADVVSIIDQIGEYKTDKLKNGNKFCPYWFATRKELLMKYLNIEWGPNMPEHETLGKLTEVMLNDGVRPFEWEEDKSDFLFEHSKSYLHNNCKGKDMGYYHIRSGSVPAYLLASKHYEHEEDYWNYLKNQPKNEYLRQCAWFYTMMDNDIWHGKKSWILEIAEDAGINQFEFLNYWFKFRKYHGL